MTNLLIVGIGGFIGAASRYLLLVATARLLQQPSFPWGVMAANVIGSLLIGLLAGLGEGRQWLTAELRLFLFIGVLGGFTTFSSITNDTLVLLRAANYAGAIANAGLTFALGMAAVALGYAAGRLSVA